MSKELLFTINLFQNIKKIFEIFQKIKMLKGSSTQFSYFTSCISFKCLELLSALLMTRDELEDESELC